MRLIHTHTLKLVEFFGDRIPERYAILSHTWAPGGHGEVTFQDWQNLDDARKKAGFFKIEMACRQARKDGLEYVWVDTNCIDKTSSAELSEAINSMFAWYRNATRCYTYLEDAKSIPDEWTSLQEESEYLQHFRQSKWFTRGWTLQELLAPVDLDFYNRDWIRLASRSHLAPEISDITGIGTKYLMGDPLALDHASVAQKMSWISQRETTRVEDMAYSMLGIFGINMPLLYGEGKHAFIRLQKKILKASTDQTIFCWTWTQDVPSDWVSLLAPCPKVFQDSGSYLRTPSNMGAVYKYGMTNAGLSIQLPVVRGWTYYLGLLNASGDHIHPRATYASIPIRGHVDSDSPEGHFVMERVSFPPSPIPLYLLWCLFCPTMIIRSPPGSSTLHSMRYDHRASCSFQQGFLLMSRNTDGQITGEMKGRKPLETTRSILKKENDTEDFPFDLETFPPKLFDRSRSLIRLEGLEPATHASVLVSVLVSLGRGRVIFLGLKFHPGKREPYRFSGVFTDISWEAGKLQRLQEQLEMQMSEQKESGPLNTDRESGYHIVVDAEVKTDIGLIYPTFVTPDRRRVGFFNWSEIKIERRDFS